MPIASTSPVIPSTIVHFLYWMIYPFVIGMTAKVSRAHHVDSTSQRAYFCLLNSWLAAITLPPCFSDCWPDMVLHFPSNSDGSCKQQLISEVHKYTAYTAIGKSTSNICALCSQNIKIAFRLNHLHTWAPETTLAGVYCRYMVRFLFLTGPKQKESTSGSISKQTTKVKWFFFWPKWLRGCQHPFCHFSLALHFVYCPPGTWSVSALDSCMNPPPTLH